MRRTSTLALLPVAAVALLGSACGSDDKAADTTTTSTTSEAASTTTTARRADDHHQGRHAACTTSQLNAELGPTNAGAGPGLRPACPAQHRLHRLRAAGVPGVSLLDGSGNQIGQPATREGNEGARP